MATRRWRGDAPAVAQVDTLTVGGTIETDDVFIMTINGKALSVTAGSTTASDVATTIATAWNASTIPEFAEITAAANSANVTLTADTAGKPFTVSVSTTESGGGAADAQTFVRAATTGSSGPNHWDTTGNWGGGAVPVAADDVVIDTGDVDILYGLAQSAVTLTSLVIGQGYTGSIGLPLVNESGSSDYFEYRDTYLAISATTLDVGEGDGNGSGRIKLDTGSVQTTLNISDSGQPAETSVPSVLWKGTHASNEVNVIRGLVGIAPAASETATVATLRVGYRTNTAGDSDVRMGSGVTLTTVEQSGGTLVIDSNTTAISMTDGELSVLSGAHTSLLVDGGRCHYRSTGTLTTAKVGGSARLDFSRDMRARTLTNCEINAGAQLVDPFKTVTFSNGVDLNRCGLNDVELDLGVHFTVDRSTI